MRNEFMYSHVQSCTEDPWAHRQYLTNFSNYDLLAKSVFCLILKLMFFLVSRDVIYVTITYLISHLEYLN